MTLRDLHVGWAWMVVIGNALATTIAAPLGSSVPAGVVHALFYNFGPGEVARVILGETVPGASFTVGELRLPRATLAALAGSNSTVGA